MKYYLVSLDPKEIHIPQITDWYEKVPVRAFYGNRLWEIKNRNLLTVKESIWQPRYLKVLFSPFPLVHESVFSVFEAYGFHEMYDQMVFLDSQHAKAELYLLLHLKRLQLDVQNQEGKKRIICKYREVIDLNAFYVMEGQSCHLICSLPLIESLVRQGMTGIELSEAIIEWR